MPENSQRIAVIGAGLTGLTAAYTLRKAGTAVTVFESSENVGGAVGTVQEKGYLVETGPNTLQLNSQEVSDLIEELGLNESLVETQPAAKKRFIVRGGRPVPLPMSLPQFLTTPWLRTRGKLRLLREPFLPGRRQPQGAHDLALPEGYGEKLPTQELPEESLAELVERRLGREMLNYAINPFVAGIYAGDPKFLSVRYAFPRLFRLEQAYGSFIRGALSRRKPGHRDPDQIKARLISFREGLQTLPETLADRVGRTRIKLATAITGVQRGTDGWNVWGEDRRSRGTFDRVIFAVPAHGLARMELPEELHWPQRALTSVPHAPVVSVTLGFRRGEVGHPLDGFGVLVPEVEKLPVLGVLFPSSLFEERAPEDRVLLTTFVGGMRDPNAVAQTDSVLRHRVMGALQTLLGVKGAPTYERITRWPRAIPQCGVEHDQVLTACDDIERRCPGLHIAGNFRGGISLVQVIKSGLAIGRAVAGAV